MQQQQRAVLQIHHFTPEKNFRQSQKKKLSKMGHSHYEPCMQHDNRRCEYINRISDSHKSSILSSSRQSRLNYAAFYRLLTRLVKKEEEEEEGPRHSCNACFPLTEMQLWQKCSTEWWNKLIPNDSHLTPWGLALTMHRDSSDWTGVELAEMLPGATLTLILRVHHSGSLIYLTCVSCHMCKDLHYGSRQKERHKVAVCSIIEVN